MNEYKEYHKGKLAQANSGKNNLIIPELTIVEAFNSSIK